MICAVARSQEAVIISPLAVSVVDDDAAVRDALVRLLASDELTVLGFDSAEAFLDGMVAESLGCVVLDVRMPGIDGLELQRRLADRGVEVPIVFLTGHGDIPLSVEALHAGAFDFLEKPVDTDRLLASVRSALEQAARARERRAHRARLAQGVAQLTGREREVMAHVVAGRTSKEIARDLGVSHRTVEAHRSRIMAKTGARSLLALAEMAAASGLAHRHDGGR